METFENPREDPDLSIVNIVPKVVTSDVGSKNPSVRSTVGNGPDTPSNSRSVGRGDADDKSRSMKSVKDEFDRLGMKMPKGIIFKEEKVEKKIEDSMLPQTKETDEIQLKRRKMLMTRKTSDMSFFLRGMRKKYKKKAKVPKLQSCEKCEFTSTLPKAMFDHVLYIHTGRQIQCDKCDKKYFNMSHLKEHIEGTHEAVMQICETCNFKTNKKRHLDKHILDIHTEGSILCTECPFTTSNNSRLKYHMERKHSQRENWPKCSWPGCEYTWFHQQNVDSHYRKVHEGVRVTCEICPNMFTDKSNMQAHMMKIHKDLVIRKENARTAGSFEERYTVMKP